MKKLLLLNAFALLSLFSCSPSNDDSINNPTNPTSIDGVLVTKMTQNGDAFTFAYNGKKLSTITSGQGTTYFTYENDLIKKIEFKSGGITQKTEDYYYNSGNQLITAVNKEYSAGVASYIITKNYTYPSSNIVNYTGILQNSFNGQTTVKNYTGTIYLNGGNIVKIQANVTGSDNLNGTRVLNATYDTNNSPIRNIVGFDKLLDNFFGEEVGAKNTIINMSDIETFTITNGSGSSSNIFKSVYVVNSKNFPTLETTTVYNMQNQITDTDVTTYEYNQ